MPQVIEGTEFSLIRNMVIGNEDIIDSCTIDGNGYCIIVRGGTLSQCRVNKCRIRVFGDSKIIGNDLYQSDIEILRDDEFVADLKRAAGVPVDIPENILITNNIIRGKLCLT